MAPEDSTSKEVAEMGKSHNLKMNSIWIKKTGTLQVINKGSDMVNAMLKNYMCHLFER